MRVRWEPARAPFQYKREPEEKSVQWKYKARWPLKQLGLPLCQVILDGNAWITQNGSVIENIRHKGLARFFEDDDRRKLPASQIDKIARILGRLNEAMTVQDMGLPGYKLHPLKGELIGFWSVTVSGNWRIIFRFENGSAYDVGLIDYH